MRAQRRGDSPQATAPSATATSRKNPASPSAAAGPRSASPARSATTTVNAAAPRALQPDQHPGQAHGRGRAVGGGAVVAGHGIEDRRGYAARVRALLVVNPNATTTTAAGRDVLAHALASELKLEVLLTRYRGPRGRGDRAGRPRRRRAAGRARRRRHGQRGRQRDAAGHRRPGRRPPRGGPALAVVPGGPANVFARALGMPRDPVEATAQVLRALGSGRSRLVGLGRADDQWFTFNAGMGWDADVVAAVEQMRFRGLAATPPRYAATGCGSTTGSGATPSR